MLREINLSIFTLLPWIYAYVFTKNYTYNIFTGGKDSGKTHSIVFILLLKFLFSRNRDILVLRKFNKDHLGSTYKQFIKSIKLLDSVLRPFGFKLEKNFKYTRAPNPEITYLATGQKIMFAGMDDPGRVAGMTTEDPNRYIGFIYVEEPIEVSDLKNNSKQLQTLAAINFATIEDSVFRANKEFIKNPVYQIFMSMNMWEFLSSWIYNKFPYDNLDWEKDIDHLEKRGWIIHEDPKYMFGAGIILLHTTFMVLWNAGILEEKKYNVHMHRKEHEYETYRLISLGVPSISEAMPLLKHSEDILQKPPPNYLKGNERLIPTDIGVDIGQSQDNTAFSIMFNKINEQGKIVRDYFHVSNHSFIIPREPSLKKQMRTLILKIIELGREFPEIVHRGIPLWVHKQADQKIYEPFEDMKTEIESEYGIKLNWMTIKWAPNPALIDKRIYARVQNWKTAASGKKLIIEWPDLYNDLIYMEVDKQFKRVEDKRVMDRINSAEQYMNVYWTQHVIHWESIRNKKKKEIFKNSI